MLGDIAHYYYSDKPFQPFISAPVLRQQDSLLLAPQNITKTHNAFLDKIFVHFPDALLTGISYRSFSYDEFIAVAMIFPSDIQENETGRYGLSLTLGVLIKRNIFEQLKGIAGWYFDNLFQFFDQTFQTDLLGEQGANLFIQKLQNSENSQFFKENLREFEKRLASFSPEFNVSSRYRFQFVKSFFRNFNGQFKRNQNQRKMLPRYVICSVNIDSRQLLTKFYLSELENFSHMSMVHNLDENHLDFYTDRTVISFELDQLPSDFSFAAMHEIENRKMLCLY